MISLAKFWFCKRISNILIISVFICVPNMLLMCYTSISLLLKCSDHSLVCTGLLELVGSQGQAKTAIYCTYWQDLEYT